MHPDDELASLRRLLDALASGSMKLLLNGRDVTQEEVAKLKPDIEYLESIWRESAALERAMRKRLRLRFRNLLVANRSRLMW